MLGLMRRGIELQMAPAGNGAVQENERVGKNGGCNIAVGLQLAAGTAVDSGPH